MIRRRASAVMPALCAIAVYAIAACAPGVAAAPLQPTGEEAWVDRYDPPGEANAFGIEPLVAPDGETVYSIGVRSDGDSHSYRVVALASGTGEHLWEAEAAGNPTAAALSPEGTRIYLAGITRTDDVTRQDWSIHALDAADGDELWSAKHADVGRRDLPNDIEVAPDGEDVYVVGQSVRRKRRSKDFTTLALHAATGEPEWVRLFDGRGRPDEAVDLTIDPSGSALYVTGYITVADSDTDYATVAYDASSGRTLWKAREDGPGIDRSNELPAAVVADDERVYVAGQSTNPRGDPDWLTVAYRGRDGRPIWRTRYDRRGRPNGEEHAYAMALSPRGRRLYVTGDSRLHRNDALTISYYASDGSEAWVSRYDGPDSRNDLGWDIVAAPDRDAVYVTGESITGARRDRDFVTLAYSARDGELDWSARYGGPDQSVDSLPTVAVQPDSKRVFVVGDEWVGGNIAFTTLAYEVPRRR